MMGRSVSYPSAATVVTFKSMESGYVECDCGADVDTSITDTCEACGASGFDAAGDDYEQLIDDFREHLKTLFPSVEDADHWIGSEDHVLAENKLARFGMSEYCGLVAYWIVPKTDEHSWGGTDIRPRSEYWVRQVADKFVAAFGELSKVGSMSNGEGVYRRIDK